MIVLVNIPAIGEITDKSGMTPLQKCSGGTAITRHIPLSLNIRIVSLR